MVTIGAEKWKSVGQSHADVILIIQLVAILDLPIRGKASKLSCLA